ncbi:DUF4236 domain-containing protein [Thalassotalea fonticola]|uniref:DUF4236 domain-containing protein n=1 Tax=Thalassotalea fonticola TaxID=3065649 RepID=A0ABZ0GPW9_9GAMM|nr:DUF4236 domain-containing protein [Colwelliaceae bacterium S1-1]WOH37668.1 DUF4236 domain-containing protein [Colwelliaceae bacterium S1-1]
MGVFLRKSIKVGAFRFNLSKSGVGVSAGVKGLRLGTGPRGNYVRIGTKGIYYSASLPKPPNIDSNPRIEPINLDSVKLPVSSTHEELKEIDSADTSQIVDSSSVDLLNELNLKQKKLTLFPIVFAIFILLVLFGYYSKLSNELLGVLIFLGVGFSWFSHNRDILAKTSVLLYDFEPKIESNYNQLIEGLLKISQCAKVWHISASGKVLDQKYHAGASDLVERKETTIKVVEPPNIKTNVKSIAIAVGRQTLHFFPDRVLIFDANGVGAANYYSLKVNAKEKQFIEEDGVPSDAKVVDKTWKYVNKSGGPDRRFNDNHEIPICLYEEILFKSRNGINEIIQLSSCGKTKMLLDAFTKFSTFLPKEVVSQSEAA